MSHIDLSVIKRRVEEARDVSKSPAIAKFLTIPNISLSDLRRMCDLCTDRRDHIRYTDTGEIVLCAGGANTYVNADKLVHLRDLVELALKFYNDTKLKSFKLVKVCKINVVGAGYFGLTFRAQEDGSEECPLFRGVVQLIGEKTVLFCEIKEDDEITLLPYDDDYVGSERACESEDCSPCVRKSDSGDGSMTGSDVSLGLWAK